MSQFRLQFTMVLATIFFFILTLCINEWLFSYSELVPGINWIYLPAGVRLLSTLLFGGAGALGLLIVSWLVSFFYFFPHDFMRAFAGGIVATVAPYGVYLVAQRAYGLQSSLANLTPGRLLVCITACSLASPLLHHIWFAIYEPPRPLLKSFLTMAAGDLNGTLLVVYAAKMMLSLLPRQRTG
ncbi:MAG TPA: hypothetical protein VF797_07120 [Noviherbaspirillum sp.]